MYNDRTYELRSHKVECSVYKAKKKETFYLVVGQKEYSKYLSKWKRKMIEVIASLLRYYALNTSKSFMVCRGLQFGKRGGHDSGMRLLGRVTLLDCEPKSTKRHILLL